MVLALFEKLSISGSSGGGSGVVGGGGSGVVGGGGSGVVGGGDIGGCGIVGGSGVVGGSGGGGCGVVGGGCGVVGGGDKQILNELVEYMEWRVKHPAPVNHLFLQSLFSNLHEMYNRNKNALSGWKYCSIYKEIYDRPGININDANAEFYYSILSLY
jgi:hypothetical protein